MFPTAGARIMEGIVGPAVLSLLALPAEETGVCIAVKSLKGVRRKDPEYKQGPVGSSVL